jgi:hypothetical protein
VCYSYRHWLSKQTYFCYQNRKCSCLLTSSPHPILTIYVLNIHLNINLLSLGHFPTAVITISYTSLMSQPYKLHGHPPQFHFPYHNHNHNHLFSIPAIHQSGYRTCQQTTTYTVQDESLQYLVRSLPVGVRGLQSAFHLSWFWAITLTPFHSIPLSFKTFCIPSSQVFLCLKLMSFRQNKRLHFVIAQNNWQSVLECRVMVSVSELSNKNFWNEFLS